MLKSFVQLQHNLNFSHYVRNTLETRKEPELLDGRRKITEQQSMHEVLWTKFAICCQNKIRET